MNTSNPPRNTLAHGMRSPDKVIWDISPKPVEYGNAVEIMEKHVSAIQDDREAERVWLLEHPPLYTGGNRSQPGDLLDPHRFPVHMTGRGGEYTYHGPGQRIAYPILDLSKRGQDLRLYVSTLEQWIINTLDALNVKGERREDRVGVWVVRPDLAPLADGSVREDKIAAIGIRVRRWISFHGISLNIDPNLDHYNGIISCGVRGHGVTSLVDLGLPVTIEDVDLILKQEFQKLFGPQ